MKFEDPDECTVGETDQLLGLNPVRDLVDYARRNGLEKRAQSDA